MLFQSHLDPTIDGDRLLAQILNDFPDVDSSLLKLERPTAPDAPLSFSYGDQMIVLMPVAAQVGDDLNEIAAHSRLWPNEVPAPSDYRAHTIVTVLRPNAAPSHVASIADAILLSKVIASAVALSDTIVAVYFGSANHVILPAIFRDLALETLPNPILPAWVALNVAPRPDGVMTGHTRGLDMLNLMDVEIAESQESAEDTFTRIVNTAIYQIENGPIVGDGDTIGETNAADVVARHAPSQVDEDKIVLALEFIGAGNAPVGGQQKKRRWFGRKR
ncbi:DUF4261 domain-containing protein [Gordonia hydrophobica]|uniref:DUF4261 domain-containing protein n=1 Tax=Gordonia hydrophobica TaxID=40516 RepID=A0ABZ2U095_9ACTN|nr:DUF4261 domain-containing protein [Gordonia hydrophobica]MBM7367773.1 hypothetical protein [Gordonia hydrophobica]